MSLYQTGQFEEAKKSFIAVEVILPDYKQASNFLERLDDDILRKKEADLERVREDQVKWLYSQAQTLYQNGQFAQAKEKFLQVEAIYPGYKETFRILGGIDVEIDKQKKSEEERIRNEDAEKIYAQALAAYQAGDLVAAKEKFVKVEVAAPDYKDTSKYLAHLDSDIERKKLEDEHKAKVHEVDPVYTTALGLYREKNYVEARNKFNEVQAMMPGYQDTVLYLSQIEKDIRDQEIRLVREEQNRKSEGLYAAAIKLYAITSSSRRKKSSSSLRKRIGSTRTQAAILRTSIMISGKKPRVWRGPLLNSRRQNPTPRR